MFKKRLNLILIPLKVKKLKGLLIRVSSRFRLYEALRNPDLLSKSSLWLQSCSNGPTLALVADSVALAWHWSICDGTGSQFYGSLKVTA